MWRVQRSGVSELRDPACYLAKGSATLYCEWFCEVVSGRAEDVKVLLRGAEAEESRDAFACGSCSLLCGGGVARWHVFNPLIWVDTNKGDENTPFVRSRICVRECKKGRNAVESLEPEQLFSAKVCKGDESTAGFVR